MECNHLVNYHSIQEEGAFCTLCNIWCDLKNVGIKAVVTPIVRGKLD